MLRIVSDFLNSSDRALSNVKVQTLQTVRHSSADWALKQACGTGLHTSPSPRKKPAVRHQGIRFLRSVLNTSNLSAAQAKQAQEEADTARAAKRAQLTRKSMTQLLRTAIDLPLLHRMRRQSRQGKRRTPPALPSGRS